MICHNVYFTLREKSDGAIRNFLSACDEYLTNHPGVTFFACGLLEPELARPVNDLDFDVALNLVFEDRAAHDVYQKSERHVRFIEENRDNIERVRIFDSKVES